MTTRSVTGALLVVLLTVQAQGAADNAAAQSRRTIRTIGQTIVVGESDLATWKAVLDVLPVRPDRIEVLDLNSLSASTRHRLRGLDAFVVQGSRTIVVIRQGGTLRHAENGDAVDRLVLASLVWHELAHVNGADERAAFEQERLLWRRFIAAGLVDGTFGLAYIVRLDDEAGASRASRSEAKLAAGPRIP
jgi:hypothetical protein